MFFVYLFCTHVFNFNLNLCSTFLTPYSYFYRARLIWYVAISIMSTFQWGSWLPQLIQQPSVLWFRHYYFKNGLKSFYKLSVTVQQMALLICYAGLYIQQIRCLGTVVVNLDFRDFLTRCHRFESRCRTKIGQQLCDHRHPCDRRVY